jgi:hypothetical protein
MTGINVRYLGAAIKGVLQSLLCSIESEARVAYVVCLGIVVKLFWELSSIALVKG